MYLKVAFCLIKLDIKPPKSLYTIVVHLDYYMKDSIYDLIKKIDNSSIVATFKEHTPAKRTAYTQI